MRLASLAPVLCALLLPATAARAADPPALEVFLYLWGESLHGKIDTDKGEASMHMSFSDVLENLNLAAMGRARANFGRFMVVGDVEYAKLESDSERRTVRLGPRGGLELQTEVEVELTEWVIELNGGYRVFETRSFMAGSSSDPRRFAGELYAGARYLSIKPEIDIEINAQSRDLGETEAWVDGVVGARLFLDLSRTTTMSLQGDVGGFGIGNSSDISYSGILALTWRLSDSLALHAGYKLLDFRRDIGDAEMKQQQRGPFLATSLAF